MSELQLFHIEDFIGGNQNYFTDYWMRLGGCGAVTACDICIYFALYFGKKNLYPYDLQKMTKEDYTCFANAMRPYLEPRIHGIDKLEIFADGLKKYLQDKKEYNFQLDNLYSNCSFEDYREAICSQIDKKMPVPYLNLKHQDPGLQDYVWHWFWVAGYERFTNATMLKVITYGGIHWLSLKRLWNTGYKEKGGIVLINLLDKPLL